MDEDDLDQRDDEYGEMVELSDDAEDDVEDTDDGGAIVRLEDEDAARDADFLENLAEVLPDHELNALATMLVDLIGRDKEARKKRDEQYEEGLRRTGLGDDAPGGAQFQGASRVVHPMMVSATVDFAARAMKELFPPQGPAKSFIPGEVTPDKVKKSKRKTDMMNWQLTVQCTEARAEIEQMLTQVPLGGAQYLKLSWDESRNRPGFLFVAIDDMLLPYAATSFYTAQRKTHVQYITQVDYEQRVKAGMYRDVDIGLVSMEPEPSIVQKANDKIEGRTDTSYNEDGLRTVYETHALLRIEGDTVAGGELAPYIVTIDKTSNKVLALYRNWDELDASREELVWFIEFPFVPWRGAYPIGLPHMVGGLSAAATGALRALLDSAHISNAPTMLKLKGGSRGGQSLNIQPTQVEEIEGGLNVDDIRKIAMPLPFNPPSAVLFQLLGFLVDAGQGVIRTTMDDIADGNPNAPVGTTLAKLEQGMVVFSAIHARLHDAMARMLKVLHRLNGMYLDDADTEAEVGEELATRSDFEGPMDVVPVSDPNIFSEAQRFAQVQAVVQRAAAQPQLYNQRKVEERVLETLKIPDAEGLLNPPVEPQELNAVAENVAASMGKPVTAYPEQDHIAHLKTHLAFMRSPAFGMSQLIAPAFLPVMMQHLKEHVAMWYASSVLDAVSDAAGFDVSEDMKEIKGNHEERRALDRALAEAGAFVVEQGGEVFKSMPEAIAQAQELMQKLSPPQPMDPAQAAVQSAQMQAQAKQAELQQRSAVEQAKMQITAQQAAQDAQVEQARLQIDAQRMQQEAQLKAAAMQQDAMLQQQREQAEDQRTAAELNARMQMNTEDNRTAMELAAAEIASGEKVAVSTGTGINPNP
jgi:hypothetical protein